MTDLESKLESMTFLLRVGGVRVGVAGVKLGHHVDKGHVEEDPGRRHEDPRGHVLEVAQQDSNNHSAK